MKSKNEMGLTGMARQTLARILSHVLEDECMLSATTRDFRWKMTGTNFQSLHKLFEDQRRQIDYWLDRVMARTRAVGVPASGSVPDPAAAAGVTGKALPARKAIGELLALHERMAQRLRDDVEACGAKLGDRNTADLLTQLVEFHETTAWMLRTLLDSPEAVRS